MISIWHIVVYIVGLFLWYLFYGLECAMNGGQLGRHPFFFPVQSYWEEVLWNLPGGRARWAEEYFRNVGLNDFICGTKGPVWYGKKVAANNLFAQCGKDVLPGQFHFVFWTVILFWLPTLTLYGLL